MKSFLSELSIYLIRCRRPNGWRILVLTGIFTILSAKTVLLAQDLEPRRWGHLPTGANFAGAGYLFTDGGIAFDPILRIDNATVEMHTYALKYIHSFETFGKSARFDLTQGYQDGTWEGLLNGNAASASRIGWSDTVMRFAVNLFGAPPLGGKEFAAYRAGIDGETIIGVGIAAVLPTGQYFSDKLINLGENRYTFRPQIGAVHEWDKWSLEFTGSTWLFGENDEFWNGNLLEVDPLVSLQGHLVHTFAPGLWLGLSTGYDFGGESTINGIAKSDHKSQLSGGIMMGIPINRKVGLKFGYIGSRTRERVGADLDTLVFSTSVLW